MAENENRIDAQKMALGSGCNYAGFIGDLWVFYQGLLAVFTQSVVDFFRVIRVGRRFVVHGAD